MSGRELAEDANNGSYPNRHVIGQRRAPGLHNYSVTSQAFPKVKLQHTATQQHNNNNKRDGLATRHQNQCSAPLPPPPPPPPPPVTITSHHRPSPSPTTITNHRHRHSQPRKHQDYHQYPPSPSTMPSLLDSPLLIAPPEDYNWLVELRPIHEPRFDISALQRDGGLIPGNGDVCLGGLPGPGILNDPVYQVPLYYLQFDPALVWGSTFDPPLMEVDPTLNPAFSVRGPAWFPMNLPVPAPDQASRRSPEAGRDSPPEGGPTSDTESELGQARKKRRCCINDVKNTKRPRTRPSEAESKPQAAPAPPPDRNAKPPTEIYSKISTLEELEMIAKKRYVCLSGSACIGNRRAAIIYNIAEHTLTFQVILNIYSAFKARLWGGEGIAHSLNPEFAQLLKQIYTSGDKFGTNNPKFDVSRTNGVPPQAFFHSANNDLNWKKFPDHAAGLLFYYCMHLYAESIRGNEDQMETRLYTSKHWAQTVADATKQSSKLPEITAETKESLKWGRRIKNWVDALAQEGKCNGLGISLIFEFKQRDCGKGVSKRHLIDEILDHLIEPTLEAIKRRIPNFGQILPILDDIALTILGFKSPGKYPCKCKLFSMTEEEVHALKDGKFDPVELFEKL
ncbi:hypothetical protein TWF718_006515 [Orbilia javanica]|uniref:Uncharacterized protein n=1 Tax=Orbilia javanica TaxID=47235 RepID=A0AAN8RKA7_9PEZI